MTFLTAIFAAPRTPQRTLLFIFFRRSSDIRAGSGRNNLRVDLERRGNTFAIPIDVRAHCSRDQRRWRFSCRTKLKTALLDHAFHPWNRLRLELGSRADRGLRERPR